MKPRTNNPHLEFTSIHLLPIDSNRLTIYTNLAQTYHGSQTVVCELLVLPIYPLTTYWGFYPPYHPCAKINIIKIIQNWTNFHQCGRPCSNSPPTQSCDSSRVTVVVRLPSSSVQRLYSRKELPSATAQFLSFVVKGLCSEVLFQIFLQSTLTFEVPDDTTAAWPTDCSYSGHVFIFYDMV